MSRPPDIAVYTLRLNLQMLQQQPLEELEQAARGALFVADPQPPRVGTNVELEIEIIGSERAKVPAMVVWSRPARAGTAPGFRAQLQSIPAPLADRLRVLVEQALEHATKRSNSAKHAISRPQFDGVAEERVSSRDVTNPMRTQQARPAISSIPPPARPPATSIPPPLRPAATSIPPPATLPPLPAFEDMALDLVARETGFPSIPPPSSFAPDVPTKKQRPTAPPPPVRVSFTSHRNYLLHFEQFLERGEVYVAGQTALAVGMPVNLEIEVPDGDDSLRLAAMIDRPISPPDVPEAGWVAKFSDPDGNVGERLTTASFIVSTSNGR